MGIFQKSPAEREEKILKDELKSDERTVKQALKDVDRANKAELQAAKEAHKAVEDHQKAMRRVEKLSAEIMKLQNEQEVVIASRDNLERNIDIKREEHIRMQQDTIDAKARLEVLQSQIGSKTVVRQERLNEMSTAIDQVPPTRVTYIAERALEGSPADGLGAAGTVGAIRATEADRSSPERERIRSETVEYAVTNPTGTTTAVATTRTAPIPETSPTVPRVSPTHHSSGLTAQRSPEYTSTTRTARRTSLGGGEQETTTRTSRTGAGFADSDVTRSGTDAYGDKTTTNVYSGTTGDRYTPTSRTDRWGDRETSATATSPLAKDSTTAWTDGLGDRETSKTHPGTFGRDTTTTRSDAFGDRDTTGTHPDTLGNRDSFTTRSDAAGDRSSSFSHGRADREAFSTRQGAAGERETRASVSSGGGRERETTTVTGPNGEREVTTTRTEPVGDTEVTTIHTTRTVPLRNVASREHDADRTVPGGHKDYSAREFDREFEEFGTPRGKLYEKETITTTTGAGGGATSGRSGIQAPRFVREMSDRACTPKYAIPPDAGIAQAAVESPGLGSHATSGMIPPPHAHVTMETLSTGLAA